LQIVDVKSFNNFKYKNQPNTIFLFKFGCLGKTGLVLFISVVEQLVVTLTKISFFFKPYLYGLNGFHFTF